MTLLPRVFKNRGKSIVLRKIRRGRVKINGYWFEPEDKPISSDLDGTNCAFGVYWQGDRMEDFVCLWGGEEMFSAPDDERFEQASDAWHKNITDPDGYMFWTWWKVSRVQSIASRNQQGVVVGAVW